MPQPRSKGQHSDKTLQDSERLSRLAADSISEVIQQVIDSTPAKIHTALPDGSIDFFNQTWLDYVGLPLEELEGWKWTASIHPSDVEGIVAKWRSSLATGEPFLYEARVRRADGQYRWMLHHKIALHDEHGQIVKWYGSSIDVEDRKRAEEELRKSEERWRAVFENSAVGIALTDVSGRFLATNAAYQRMLGYDSVEFEGRSFLDMTYEEDRERNRKLVTELLEGKREQFQIEKRDRRKDGVLIWVRNSVSLVPGTERTPQAIMAIVEDITEPKHTGEVLRESEARFRWMADAIPEVIWFTALEPERVLYVSPSFERIWGLPVEDLYRNPRLWAETILPEDRDRVREAFERWIAGEDLNYQGVEYRIRQPNGVIRWIHERGVLRLDDQGRPSLASGISTDITERKRAEEELHEMQMELAHVTRVATTGEIAASIAHEISQPLTAVMTNASASLRWLSVDQPNLTEGKEGLVRIVRDVGRASEVIDRIRALLKKTPPQMGRLSINELIQDVLVVTRTELVKRSVLLRTDLADGLPVLLGDRVQLQQVILNLLLNGVEALREVPNVAQDIMIASKFDESKEVLVLVRDSGVGVSPDRLEKIFMPFYTTKTQGLGMGLSISRSIIEAHGGRMWATTNADRGMTVQFTLPVCMT